MGFNDELNKYKIIELFDMDPDIERWNVSRTKINKCITRFNNWQIDWDFQHKYGITTAVIIKNLLTHDDIENNETYTDPLEEMLEFIEKKYTH